MKKKIILYGEVSSHGYVEGHGILIPPYKNLIPQDHLENINLRKKELKKFEIYLSQTIKKIHRFKSKIQENVREFLEIQIYFLKDPILHESVKNRILVNGENVALAIWNASVDLKNFFYQQATEFIKSRWIDFQDAIENLLDITLDQSYTEFCIQKINNHLLEIYNRNQEASYILIAEDLSSLLYLKIPKPSGILLKYGNLSNHLMLLAANQGIPILINLKPEQLFDEIQEISWCMIDTQKKKAIIQSDIHQSRKIYGDKILEKKNYNIDSKIFIHLNADDYEIIQKHSEKFIPSVGLFRTEFLYLKNIELLYNTRKAIEEYKKIFRVFEENKTGNITLRLIDLDEDKYSIHFYSSTKHIGKRGIDYYKLEKKIILNQMESIFTAFEEIHYSNWKLKILVPMVRTYEDWLYIHHLIQKYEKKWIHKRQYFEKGIMLEMISIFYDIDKISREVDFFSMGTNDLLCSFLFKKRRELTQEDYFNPSFYRMLKEQLPKISGEINLCGNLATQLEFIPLFYFLGIRSFSVPLGSYSILYDFSLKFLKNYSQSLNYLFEDLFQSLSSKKFYYKLKKIFKENFISHARKIKI